MTDKLPTFDMDLDDSMEVDMVDSPARQSQEDLYKRVHRRIIFEDEPTQPTIGSETEDVSRPSSTMITKLLKKPLKMCTSADSVTPGRENNIFRRAVQGLQVGSPFSPRAFKRPVEVDDDFSSPVDSKRTKATTMGDGFTKPLKSHALNTECTPIGKKTRVNTDINCNAPKYDGGNKLLPALKILPDVPSPSTLNRAVSESHLSIMKAVEGLGSNPNLIGDGSKSYSLPMVQGKSSDLKEISPETMAALLRGEFANGIRGFEIVDCRFPYEYRAGHIQGAVNITTQAQLFERYLGNKGPIVPGVPINAGFILIFHCEFSAQRGPAMCRFLRDADRNINMISYPSIYYPEVYILAGGYKKFFQTHQGLCTPQNYVSMFDPNYVAEMKFYRSHSKSSLVKTKSSNAAAEVEVEPIGPYRNKSSCFKKLEL